jgi:4Fe-4S iron-sulfur cluster binding domain/DR2241 stabilising domain
MSPTAFLSQSLASGVHRIGQIEIRATGSTYQLFHADDLDLVDQPNHGGLTVHHDPEIARDISTYAEDSTYRFTKGQTNLKRGWIMRLDSLDDTRHALDLFYPAALGLVAAQREGTLQIETLREKLNRQTGMYRFARNISDAGAQQLVQEVCGPAHQCAKWILWQLDATTPLLDSEASRFRGIPGQLAVTEAIPLVCREACNHFVAECRKVSKAEHAKA